MKKSWALGAPTALFLLLNLVPNRENLVNPRSRLAVLAAMKEDRSFRIDAYRRDPYDWTLDWARGPDGHFYSNKAPGPILYAYPVYALLDPFFVSGDRRERDEKRYENFYLYDFLLSFFTQALPWAVLGLLFCQTLGAQESLLLLTALFFGTTASLFVKSFWGHAAAAAGVLALVWSLRSRREAWAGFAWGSALIMEYSSGLLLLPALLWLWRSPAPAKRFKNCLKFAAGASAPLLLGAVYHQICFGKPWALPTSFQNPDFVSDSSKLWGVLSLPRLDVLVELLVGPRRGLLLTQGWVLLLVLSPLWLWKKLTREERGLWAFATTSLGLLLLFNSAFNGWHGGDTPGPRYLSATLPLFAVMLPSFFRKSSTAGRSLLLGFLALSLLFYVAVSMTTHLAPPSQSLVPFYFRQLQGAL